MKKLLSIFFLVHSTLLLGQYQDCKIKELYDVIYKRSNDYVVENGYDNTTAYTSDTTFGNLERIGNIIESNIVMYETTKDKAYLIKAVNKSIEMINKRGGPYTPGQTNYTWGNGWQNTLCNSQCYIPNVPGVLLWSMAHLCHLILYDEVQLCSTPLPTNLLISNTSNYPYTNGIATYGLFADWLARRCVESLDWYLANFWLGPDEGFREEDNENYGGGINQQAPFAAAFFYLGHLTTIAPCFAYQGFYSGLASYMQRATELANLFTSTIKLYKDGECQIEPSNNCFERPIFNHISSTNSYWWLTTGWGFGKQNRSSCNNTQRVNCSDYFDIGSGNNQNSIEDISHGIRTLIYPRICYKYNFITGGNPYFDIFDMYRFRNTFTNVVWTGNMNNPEFYYTVSGAGYNSYASTSSCNPCTNEHGKWAALNWIPLQEFDFMAGNSLTYQIIMQHFYNLRTNQQQGPDNFKNGGKMWALAEMVKAQWQKECVNTTLYKRILTYNQDFFVKNTLTVAPEEELPQIYSHSLYNVENSYSMAEPLTQDKIFTIEPGVSCTMKAGERIVLKPGFHAKVGSNFRAYIEPNLCTDGQIAPPGGGGNNEPNYESWVAQANTKSIKQQEEHSAQTTTNTSLKEHQNILLKQEFNIHPNPNTGIFSIYVQTLNEQEQLQLSVMDVYGKQLLAQQINNSVNHQIDLSVYSKGIYYVSVIGSNGFREVKKVVVN